MSEIGLILLAAGGSTRMGRPKQLLPYEKTTLLRHAAQQAVKTGHAPIVVVLGAEAEFCQAELENLPVSTTINPAWKEGMSSSIRTGIETLLRLAPHIHAALILLHDQPLIPSQKLAILRDAWNPPEILAVASIYGGTFGVPALFDRSLFPELIALTGNQGARKVLEAHAPHVAKIDLPEAAYDIDSPADYERLIWPEIASPSRPG